MNREIWVVYFRRYQGDSWHSEIFTSESKARRFANNKYEAEERSAQTVVKHYTEIRQQVCQGVR